MNASRRKPEKIRFGGQLDSFVDIRANRRSHTEHDILRATCINLDCFDLATGIKFS